MTSTPVGGASPLTLQNGFRCRPTPEMNTSIEDVLLAVGAEVGHENISSASRMNKAVVVFLRNENQVKNLKAAFGLMKHTCLSHRCRPRQRKL